MAMAFETEEGNQTNQPIWQPSKERIEATTLWAFKNHLNKKFGLNLEDYQEILNWSNDNKAEFWGEIWDYFNIIGDRGEEVCSSERGISPGAHFFKDTRINYAENLLQKRNDKIAIVFRGEDKIETRLTYNDLYNKVSQLAQAFKSLGIEKGDRICSFMPNMPETIIGWLAAASIGAIWSSASPDFGVKGILDRFGQIEPKVMLACGGYHYNGKTHSCLEKIEEIQKQIHTLE